jgi:hypothetical protein
MGIWEINRFPVGSEVVVRGYFYLTGKRTFRKFNGKVVEIVTQPNEYVDYVVQDKNGKLWYLRREMLEKRR